MDDTVQEAHAKIDPVKVGYPSKSELESVCSYFAFFSPSSGYIEKAPEPVIGECWKLQNTLKSGLYLGIENTWLEMLYRRFRGKRFNHTGYDWRAYHQGDIEEHKRKKELLIHQYRKTYSLAWYSTKSYPYEQLLVTAGDGGLVKLWDIKKGILRTDYANFRGDDPGNKISWSSDGSLFISGENHIFDGKTGDRIDHKPFRFRRAPHWPDTYRLYSLSEKTSKPNGEWFRSCYWSSSCNLSPWRPNTHQLTMVGDKLTLYDALSEKIELVISCDVPSKIEDFSWHPGGRFIALAFEEDNVKVIDVENMKYVFGSSSANRISGWSSDGKFLLLSDMVGEDKDFTIWEASKLRETKGLSKALKNEICFKSLFTNISADFKRYLEFKFNDKKVEIFSLETDKLLNTLTFNRIVENAAWSPDDARLLAICAGEETYIFKLQ